MIAFCQSCRWMFYNSLLILCICVRFLLYKNVEAKCFRSAAFVWRVHTVSLIVRPFVRVWAQAVKYSVSATDWKACNVLMVSWVLELQLKRLSFFTFSMDFSKIFVCQLLLCYVLKEFVKHNSSPVPSWFLKALCAVNLAQMLLLERSRENPALPLGSLDSKKEDNAWFGDKFMRISIKIHPRYFAAWGRKAK